MGWFLIFAASVFALYFWREYKVQQGSRFCFV